MKILLRMSNPLKDTNQSDITLTIEDIYNDNMRLLSENNELKKQIEQLNELQKQSMEKIQIITQQIQILNNQNEQLKDETKQKSDVIQKINNSVLLIKNTMVDMQKHSEKCYNFIDEIKELIEKKKENENKLEKQLSKTRIIEVQLI